MEPQNLKFWNKNKNYFNKANMGQSIKSSPYKPKREHSTSPKPHLSSNPESKLIKSIEIKPIKKLKQSNQT